MQKLKEDGLKKKEYGLAWAGLSKKLIGNVGQIFTQSKVIQKTQ